MTETWPLAHQARGKHSSREVETGRRQRNIMRIVMRISKAAETAGFKPPALQL